MSDYSPSRAWQRAAVYFAACWLIAAATGTLPRVWRWPPATADQLRDPRWLAFTALCLVIIVVGYGVIWPLGTATHGRPLVWAAVLPFGVLWGLSEGQLFAAVWSAAFARWGASVWTVAVAFLVLAAFIGLWHQFYWDVAVAPLHNIEVWNARKVLLVHTPNLIATLTWLTLYRNGALFVLLQTLALLLSTIFMRFPPFWTPAHRR